MGKPSKLCNESNITFLSALSQPSRLITDVFFSCPLTRAINSFCRILLIPTAEPISRLAPLLRDIPAPRLYDEIIKLLLGGKAERTFELLCQYGLFAPLFPASGEALERDPEYAGSLIRQALANTDTRIREGKPVTPAFLFAALLWPALPARVLRLQSRGMPPIPAMQ